MRTYFDKGPLGCSVRMVHRRLRLFFITAEIPGKAVDEEHGDEAVPARDGPVLSGRTQRGSKQLCRGVSHEREDACEAVYVDVRTAGR